MKDLPISHCPECDNSVKRLLYPVGIVFKGSGWYINDSRGPDKSDVPSPSAVDAKTGEANAKPAQTDSKSTEGKPADTPSEPKKETAAAASTEN